MAENKKIKLTYIFAVVSITVCVFLFSAEHVKADYYAQGTVLSTNLLNGLEDVAIIESFTATSTVPASTTVSVKFSQDGTNWYNHLGYKGWWDSCADGVTTIDLTALEWTTANFYYKLKLETASSTLTPVVTDVAVNYSDTYTPPTLTDYHKKGTLLSTNLLNGLDDVAIIQSFECTAVVPASTTVYATFSQDGTDWYNADGYKGWWDSCSNGITTIGLTNLEWTTANFFYKLKFETEIATSTAMVSQVKVNYSDTYTPPTLTDYCSQGTLVSTNLLEGRGINLNKTEKFGYNITSLPTGTTAQAQFSQDGTNWYSSTSTKWAWDTLSAGNHLDVSSAINLSGLGWSGDSFYYKLKFTTADSGKTPVVSEVKLLRRATQVNTPLTNKMTGGLVGYWTFNGEDMDWASSTAEALDRSGQGNNGDVVGAKAAIGKVGQGLEFDGVGDYVENDIQLVSAYPFTMSAWVKNIGDSAGTNDIIFGLFDASVDNVMYWIGMRDNKFQQAGRNTDFYYTDSGIASNDGEWHHVVGVFGSATSREIFIDGISKNVDTNSVSYNTNVDRFDIGRAGDFSPAGSMEGLIDEVRIYNHALSASEILDLYKAGARKLQVNTPITNKQTSGLVGHWTFNGPDMDWGSTTAEALDRSGQGNNGDVIGAKPVIGKVGQGLEFDGSGDYVDITDDNSLSFTEGSTVDQPYSISVWVYMEDVTTAQRIISKFGYADLREWIMYISSDDFYIQNYHYNDNSIHIGEIASDVLSTRQNAWTYITVTYDGSENGNGFDIFFNGIDQNGTADNTGAYTGMGNTAKTVEIGSFNGGADYFNGIIDEVRVYNRVLSAEEIGELYRMGMRRMEIRKE